jgi:NAD(P)-dependent dehydrogenase (short-subunit alcohol dehydrogenase family)
MTCRDSKEGVDDVDSHCQTATLLTHPTQADMEDREAPAALVASTLERTGRLDILVNNAGIAQHGATETFPWET